MKNNEYISTEELDSKLKERSLQMRMARIIHLYNAKYQSPKFLFRPPASLSSGHGKIEIDYFPYSYTFKMENVISLWSEEIAVDWGNREYDRAIGRVNVENPYPNEIFGKADIWLPSKVGQKISTRRVDDIFSKRYRVDGRTIDIKHEGFGRFLDFCDEKFMKELEGGW